MFNWLSVMIFVIVVVLFAVNLGVFAKTVLIAFVVFMLAGATLRISLELSPSFYRYGYGLLFYHVVNGARHLLYNTHTRFTVDVGVILVFLGVLWLCTCATSIFWMNREERKVGEARIP